MSRHAHNAIETPSLYRFDTREGQVTAVYELEDGRIKQERIDPQERYTVDGQDVLKQEQEHGWLKVTRYTDADGDGWYTKVGKSTEWHDGTGAGNSTRSSLHGTWTTPQVDTEAHHFDIQSSAETHTDASDSTPHAEDGALPVLDLVGLPVVNWAGAGWEGGA